MDDATKRQVKAKLYNFKSQIDGLLGMVEGDVFDLQALDRALGAMCGQALKSLSDIQQDGV
jgi:hypothetical protein